MNDPIKPTIISVRDKERHQHPAFGMIGITMPQGGDKVLFGSDIGHNQRICIAIKAAEYERHLSNDWFCGKGKIIEVEMSHAQFAQFITTPGYGDGVPCTIKYRDTTGYIPGIEKIETKHEMYHREIQNSAQDDVSDALAALSRIEALLNDGKTSKKEFREALRHAKAMMENVPANLGFVVKQAERALESATSAAKIEIESYVAMTAQRLGLKQISDLGLALENKEKADG